MSAQAEIQIIAVLIAAACAIPGQFLVLRKMSMVTDSITHTILLGIVLGFFLTQDLSSPVLIIGAAVVGVVTVCLTELLEKTKLVSEDAAVGVVFPLLFSVAVILISRYGGSAHLDTDSVLLGELAFAPFDRLVMVGRDIGAKGIYTAGILLAVNAAAVGIFFKELKLATFDPILAAVIGFSPALLHYGLMGLVSLTAVGAFQSVGSIMVVAFMIGPPVTAYLLSDNLKTMLLISCGLGALSGVIGCRLAFQLDVSIAGSIAGVIGLVFLLVFITSPRYGVLSTMLKRRIQKELFSEYTFLLHLYHHAKTEQEQEENGLGTIRNHLGWKQRRVNRIAGRLNKKRFVICSGGVYCLTDEGEEAGLAFELEVLGEA